MGRAAQCLVLFFGTALFWFALTAKTIEIEVKAAPEPIADTESEIVIAQQDKDYSRFWHGNQYHSRLPCL